MNYKQNDYELIYMVRENDDFSRDILYEKYLPVIKGIAKDFHKVYEKYGYDFDDFVQEGLIAFQKALTNFNDDKNALFYTFVTMCVKRAMLTFCRNISRDKRNYSFNKITQLEDYEGVCVDLKADIDIISSEYEIGEISRKVLLDLPFENSCIFELKLNGFTYREIGMLLEIPTSTAEFKNRTTKRKLEIALKDYYKKTV